MRQGEERWWRKTKSSERKKKTEKKSERGKEKNNDAEGKRKYDMNDKKTKQHVRKDVTTRHGDAIGQSFPLIEVPPNHRYGWCVAESKTKTWRGWI